MRRVAFAALLLAAASSALAAEPTLLETMKQVIDPAANAFWAAGNDAPEGETPAQAAVRWQAAADGAAKMEAYGKAMIESPREGEWASFAKMMAEAGASGRAAAQARDMDAAFEAGGKLYDACSGCHAKYIPGRS